MTRNYLRSRFGIINVYLFSEVLINFGVCLFIFTFTVLMGQVFKLSELVINKGFGFLETVNFVLFLVPSLLIFVIPMSLLLGILFTLGRMSTDGEIIAFKASGLSLSQILRPILIVSFIAYLISNFFTIYLSPQANYALKKLAFSVARTKAEVGIKERTFNSDFEGLMVYVNKSRDKRLEGVLISDTRQSEEPATIIAEKGYVIPNSQALEITLQLHNGNIHRLNKKTNTYQKIDFKTYDLHLDLQRPTPDKSGITKKRKEMSIPELLDTAAQYRDQKEYYPILVDLHSRFAIPFACLVFGLFAVPLGIHSPRAGRSYGFIISLMVILIYYIFFSLGENMGRLGVINPLVSMWIPNFLFFLLSLYLFRKGKTESSIRIFEELAWYIEIIKNKFQYVIEGKQAEEPDYSSALLGINTASQKELMLKLGIGAKKAASIITYREEHQGIQNLEELRAIRGIGEKTLSKIKDAILAE